MKKMILGAVAALSVLLGVPALAAPTPPAHVNVAVVQVGHLIGDETTLLLGNKSVTVKLIECSTSWQDNQQFYLMLTKDAPPVVVRKDLFDYAWEKSGQVWDVAFQAAVAAKVICIVQKP